MSLFNKSLEIARFISLAIPSLSQCLKCIDKPNWQSWLIVKKHFKKQMTSFFIRVEWKCCWYLGPYFKTNGAEGWWWLWYLMLLRKVSRYIGLKWKVFTFSLSQVARNNAVKGKQKNTISFLYNFKHCNFVETGGEFWNTKHNPMRSIKSWF